MDKTTKEFFAALKLFEDERGLPQEYLAEKIANAIVVAMRKDYGTRDNISCTIDPKEGIFSVTLRKEIVDEVEDKHSQILREEARQIDPASLEVGYVDIKLDTRQFGRIVAQTAKHVIRQGIREVERGQTLAEFQNLDREVVDAVVQRVDPKTGNATVLIGRTETILPKPEQIPDEVINEGDHVKVYVVGVKETEKGPKVMISRSHPGLVRRLFEKEVPEIFDGLVEIKGVSRQAGSRTKLAVYSPNPEFDPIGACIGQRGSRMNAVINEIKGEKVDLIKYDEDPTKYVAAALAPAPVAGVEITGENPKTCCATVPDEKLSLAIGAGGQNVRLAAKLTGWKIDIRPESGFYGEGTED